MDTSNVVLIVTLAVYLLLPCKTAIGGEIACEVDDPHGHCESRFEKCIDEHRADQSSCRDEQRAAAAEANKHWKPDSQPECPCNGEGWSVSSDVAAARCLPDVVSVTFYQFNTLWYIVEVYWKYTEPCGSWENVVGVQVRLDDDSCYCISTNHTVGIEGRQNFTVQYNSSISRATVGTFPIVPGSGVSYATSSDTFPRPTNCYDPRLPADLARCGIPLYDPPTNFVQTHTSISNADSNEYSEMNATLSWDLPNHYRYPNRTHYYVRIRPDSTPWPNCSGDTHCFEVTNSTDITFTHLNASKMYYVKMGVYHRCSGIAVKDSVWRNGCGQANDVDFIVMLPSANLTNDSLAEVDPTSDPPVGNSVAIGVSVAVTCILGTIMVVVAVCIYAYYTHRPKDPTPPDPFPSPEPPIDDYWKAIDSLSVLVVYSDKTHEKEKMMILQTLVGSLREEYGIWSTCHDYFDGPDSMVYQTADYLKQASAVLCVCNPAFTDDWNSEHPPPVINTLKQIVAANISSGGNLSNYATVFMYARDKEYCIPHEFFKNTRQFLITDVEGIVRFVRNIPSIEVVPVSNNVFCD